MNNDLIQDLKKEQEEKEAKIAAVIKKIEANRFHLSWSALNKFMDSPKDFIAYKIKDFERTEAMILGSAVDCLLLTPDNFEKEYFLAGTIETETIGDQEKRGVVVPLSVADQKEAAMTALFKDNKGKTLLTIPQLKKVYIAVDSIKANPAAVELLELIGETQKKIEWKYMGFNFIGYIDAKGENLIADLKQCPNAQQDAFKRKVYNERLYVQGAMYATGAEQNKIVNENVTVYLLAYDHVGGVSVHKITNDLLWLGKRKYMKACKDFTRCIEERAWNLSYDFYSDTGEHLIEQANWLTL